MVKVLEFESITMPNGPNKKPSRLDAPVYTTNGKLIPKVEPK